MSIASLGYFAFILACSWLADFDEAAASSSSAPQLQAKMKAKYPKLAMDIILQIGAGAQFPPAVAEAAKK